MKKRGWITSRQLVIAIIGLIVLGVIGGVFLPQHFPKAGKAVDWVTGKVKEIASNKDFAAYEDELTTDEIIVDYSMNALMCGISNTAEKYIDEGFCKNLGGKKAEEQEKISGMATVDEKIECEGFLFGETCVECSPSYKFGSEDNKLGVDDLNKIAAECAERLKKEKKTIFCGLIPPRSIEEGITQSDLDSQLRIGFSPSPLDISQRSYYVFGIRAAPPYGGNFDSIIIRANGQLGITLTDIFFNWRKANGGDSALRKYSCDVTAFELPQDMSKSYAEKYISAIYDPKFLAYYEKFPEGEERAWEFKPKTMVLVGLGVRTVIALIPFGKILKTPLSKLPGISITNAGKLKNYGRLLRGLDKLDDTARAKSIAKMEKIMEKLPENTQRILKPVHTLARVAQSNKAYSLFTDEVTDDIAAKLLPKVQKARRVAIKRVELPADAKRVVLGADEHAIVREELKKLLPEGSYLTPNQYKQMYNKIGTNEFKDVSSLKQWLTSGSNLENGVFNHLATTGQLAAVESRIALKGTINTLLTNSNGQLAIKGMTEAMEQSATSMKMLKDVNPALFQKAMGNAQKMAGGLTDSGSIAAWEKLLADPDAAKLLLSNKYAVNVDSIKELFTGRVMGNALLQGMEKNKHLALLIGISYFIDYQNKGQKKYNPVGKNKFGSLHGEGEGVDPIPYDSSKADDYFITMVKEDGGKGRFFAASPCKTDYKIENNFCTCVMEYGGYYYDINGDNTQKEVLQPIEQPLSSDPNNIKIEYMWDRLSQENKGKFLLEHKFFKEYSTPLPEENEYLEGNIIYNGLTQIRWAIEDTEGLLEEYHNVMFKKPHEFLVTLSLMNYYNGKGYGGSRDFEYPTLANAESTLGPFKDLIKINSFTNGEFRNFQRALIEFYDEAETHQCSIWNSYKFCYDKFIYEYERNGNSEKIEISELWSVLDPIKNFVLFPIGQINYDFSKWDDLLSDYGSLEAGYKLINPGHFWYGESSLLKDTWLMDPEQLERKEEEVNDLWLDSTANWQDRMIDYNFLFGKKNSAQLFTRMMAYRFYKTDFFKKIAREKTYHYNIYTGDTTNVVKRCEKINMDEPKNNKGDSVYPTKTRIPCLSIESSEKIVLGKYGDYNGGLNYCYSAKSWQLEAIDKATFGVSIAASVVASVVSGNPYAIAVAYMADAGSIVTSFIIGMCGDWPRHSADCIPWI